MATTYLTLVNNVLNELNEPELTSSTFSSSRGIQTSVKKFVLKAMHEVYNSLSEVPDLYLSTTQDTNAGPVPGRLLQRRERDAPGNMEVGQRCLLLLLLLLLIGSRV